MDCEGLWLYGKRNQGICGWGGSVRFQMWRFIVICKKRIKPFMDDVEVLELKCKWGYQGLWV